MGDVVNEPNLELARTRLTLRHLAEHSVLDDAETMLKMCRETVAFLERRIAREKLVIAGKGKSVLESRMEERYSRALS